MSSSLSDKGYGPFDLRGTITGHYDPFFADSEDEHELPDDQPPADSEELNE